MAGPADTDRFSERQYPPTPLRLEEAARRGMSARSADLVTAAGCVAGLLALAWLGGRLVAQLTDAFRLLLGAGASPVATLAENSETTWRAARPVVTTTALVAAAAFGAAAICGILQGGWRLVPARLRPDWGRLGLRHGLGGLWSRRTWIRWAFAAAKLAAVVLVAVAGVRAALAEIVASWRLDAAGMLPLAGGLAVGLGLKVLAALGVIAAADYLYQRWEFRSGLRMTRREFLDDLKKMEGDPAARRRRKQRGAAITGAAAGRLARASVVVTGGDGQVVALQCLAGGRASRVVARATGRAGQTLRAAAAAHGIPVLADDHLASVLYARCGVGTVAPMTAHRTVAEFLAKGPNRTDSRSGAPGDTPQHQGMAALEGS